MVRPIKIGPLPLLSGLQLQPAEGKPSGLLRALNVEPRNGLVQTRRGSSVQAGITSADEWTAGVAHPATWDGETVVYVGCVDMGQNSDRIVSVELTGVVAADEVVDETVTWEYWGDDEAWHPVAVINVTNKVTGTWWGPEKRAHLTFIHPYGWKNDTPAGLPSAKQWLRATRATAWVEAHAVGVRHRENTLTALTAKAQILAPVTRKDRGPFLISPYVSAPDTFSWSVIDLSFQPDGVIGEALYEPGVDTSDYIVENGLSAELGTGFEASDNDCAGVYIPAADELLLSLSGKYIRIDCSKRPAEAASAADFATDITAEQYADIALEAAIPEGATCMCVYGGRVFIGGFKDNPQLILWSAPGEFWQVWPSDNRAFLDSGAVRAMVPVDESLFIFTSTGIIRANLGDPAEGAESALFIDPVEETPCVSTRSVVAAGRLVCFLSEDGPRVFDGRRSKLVANGVRDLFRPDSEHPLACMRKSTAVGAWHKVENQYRVSYASPAAGHNETVVVVDLDDQTAWLWGDDPTAADDVPTTDDGEYLKARARGQRVAGWAWSEKNQAIVAVDPEGYTYLCDQGSTDLGDTIPWHMESQTLGIAESTRAVVCRVDIQVQIEHLQAVSVVVIPDGDEARADTRTITVQRPVSEQAAIDAAPLALPINPSQLRASLSPITARFRKAGRNHRVRVQSVSPTHHPITAMTMTVEGHREEAGR